MMTPISKIALMLRNGKSVKQSSDAGGLPITRIETIADGVVNPVRVGFADLEYSECASWMLEIGDILISHINSKKHLGKCAIYQGTPAQIVHGMNLLGLRVDQKIAYPKYVHSMLSSPSFKKLIPQITKDSVNQSSFNISSFKNLQIPLPPLAEQKRIAAILDAADALRAKRRETLAQLDTLLQSTFLDMFGDPVTNPKGWEVCTLKDTKSKIQIGPFGSLLHKEDYISGGIPLINPMHIVSSKIQTANDQSVSEEKAASLAMYRLKNGDVIMGRRGEMGRCAIVSDIEAGMLCGTGSLFVRPNKDEMLPLYVAKVLSSISMKRHLEELSQGVTMPNLNRIMIEKLKIPVPPLDLQHRFATIVESVEKQKIRLRTHLAELDTLFASLQSRAFNGEL